MEQTKYGELKETIIKANPSIKDLVFGCKFTSVDGWGKVNSYVVTKQRKDGILLGMNDDLFQVYPFIGDEFDKLKIIGRDIRLADVLLAITLSEHLRLGDIRICFTPIRDKPCMMLEVMRNKEEDSYEYWLLKDDNLDNQSEETKEFLYELLVKEGK